MENTQGVLRLVDLRSKDMSINCAWYNIIRQDCAVAQLAYQNMVPKLGEVIWKCNTDPKHVGLFVKEPFWRDVMISWMTMKERQDIESDEVIWMNSTILVKGHPIIWKRQISKGLIYVHQLFQNNHLKSVLTLQAEYDLSWLESSCLYAALPKKLRGSKALGLLTEEQPSKLKPNRIYLSLIFNDKLIRKKKSAWEQELKMEISDEQFVQCYQDIRKITNVPK